MTLDLQQCECLHHNNIQEALALPSYRCVDIIVA